MEHKHNQEQLKHHLHIQSFQCEKPYTVESLKGAVLIIYATVYVRLNILINRRAPAAHGLFSPGI